jgi:hypothetical protein
MDPRSFQRASTLRKPSSEASCTQAVLSEHNAGDDRLGRGDTLQLTSSCSRNKGASPSSIGMPGMANRRRTIQADAAVMINSIPTRWRDPSDEIPQAATNPQLCMLPAEATKGEPCRLDRWSEMRGLVVMTSVWSPINCTTSLLITYCHLFLAILSKCSEIYTVLFLISQS